MRLINFNMYSIPRHTSRSAVALTSGAAATTNGDQSVQADEIEEQNESVQEFQRTQPPTPSGPKKSITPSLTKAERSRGQQTAWIVGTLVVIGLVALYFATRMPEGARNAECQTLFGMDKQCVVENARARLLGYEPSEDQVDPLAPGRSGVAGPVAHKSAEVDEEWEAEIDSRLAEFDAETLNRSPTADPELEMGSRQAVEINEMICRETGQNCEVAKMARRQHIERYGRF